MASTFASAAIAGPGDHIQISDTTTITPEIGVGVEARSNSYLSVGRFQSRFPRDNAVASLNFLLRPRLQIAHDSNKVRFNFDGVYELRKYFDPELAANLDRFSDFNIDTRLDVLPRAVVGFNIKDTAVIRNRESDNPYQGNSLLTQFRNDLGAGLVVRPGPEFDIEAGFGWAHHAYRVPGSESDVGINGAAEQRALNTRQTFAPALNVSWRFYPNTAFVVEASYQMNRWADNWIPTNQQVPVVESGLGAVRSYGDFLAMPDSDFFKGMVGVRGRFTRSLVLSAMLGWGSGRYDVESVAEESASDPGLANEADPDAAGFGQNVKGLDGLLAVAKVDVDLGHRERRPFGQSIGFLYRKDFQDSFFTNYVHQHHLRLGLDSRWGKYVGTAAGVGARFESYVGEVDRNDIFLRVDFGFQFDPTRYLRIDLGGNWTQRASSQKELQYDNVTGRLMLTFAY